MRLVFLILLIALPLGHAIGTLAGLYAVRDRPPYRVFYNGVEGVCIKVDGANGTKHTWDCQPITPVPTQPQEKETR